MMLVLSSLLLASAMGAVPGDEVKSLPLYSGTVAPGSFYAGYLDIQSSAGAKSMHYLYSKAESDANGDAPVVFWFTGGPGCSSDAAFFTEQGLYHFSAETGAPQVVKNDWAWSNVAHVVFIDSPSGVGYSYSATPAGNVHNDTSSAVDNYHTLLAFFAAYPELKTRKVYITGESYAGIYVPMLAQQVVRNGGINLAGIMVGNGCIGTEKGGCSSKDGQRIDWAFLAGNHLISQVKYQAILSACNNFEGPPSAACDQEINDAYNQVGRLDVYDVYTPCIAFDAGEKKAAGTRRFFAPPSPVDLALGDGPSGCFDNNDTTTQYLNMPEVRAALHAKPASQIGPWSVCTDRIQYTPTMTDETTLVYPELLDAGLHINIYNGNFDLCVPVNGNEEWTSEFGNSNAGGVAEAWRPWLVDSQVQGYITTYKGKGNGSFRFVTVNAAGHMVPQFQPERAFHMFTRFLGMQPF